MSSSGDQVGQTQADDGAIQSAESLRLSGRLVEAETLLWDALKQRPRDAGLLTELGTVYIGEQRYKEAVSTLEAALREAAQSPDAQLLKYIAEGLIDYDAARYKKALVSFDRALALDPDNEFALRQSVNSLVALTRVDDAQNLIDSAVTRHPDEAQLLMMRAEFLSARGRTDDALIDVNAVLQKDPDNQDALRRKTTLLRLAGQFEESQTVLSELLEKSPTDNDLLTEQGLLLYDQGKWGDAFASLDQALRGDPLNEIAEKYRASSLRLTERYDEALQALTSAMQRHPDDPDLMIEQAGAYLGKGQYPKALAILNDILAREPNYSNALLLKAIVLRLMKQLPQAHASLADALRLSPGDPRVLNEYASLLYDEKRYKEAADAFNDVLEIQPDNTDALKYKQYSLRLARRFDDAQSAITVALQKLPNDVNILNERALLFYDQLRFEEAVPAFDDVLSIDPKNGIALSSKAYALRMLRRTDDAQALLATALKDLPDNPDLLYQQALLSTNLRQNDEALTFFETAARNAEAGQRTDLQSQIAYSWGYVLASVGRTSEALEEYRAAISFDDSAWAAYSNIAAIYWSAGSYTTGRKEWEKAKQVYEKLVEGRRDSRDSQFFYSFGSALQEIFEDFDGALKAFEMGRDADPADPHNSIGLSNHYLARARNANGGERAEARWRAWNEYRRASDIIARDTALAEDADILRQLAELQISIGTLEDAEKNLAIASARDSNSAIIADLGVLASTRGDTARAVQCFTEAKTRDPFDLSIRMNLAEAYYKSKQLGAARAEYRELLDLTDEHIESWVGLAEVYTAMAETGETELYDDAITHFTMGISLAVKANGKRLTADKLAAAYYSRAYARVKASENLHPPESDLELKRALDDFRRCYTLAPGNYKAQKAIEKLSKRLYRFTPQNFSEFLSSWSVAGLALLLLFWTQVEFYWRTASGEAAQPKPLSEASYAVITFGAFMLVIAGLYLPRILRLKLGGIELEKSVVEQISSPSSLSIGRDLGDLVPSTAKGAKGAEASSALASQRPR